MPVKQIAEKTAPIKGAQAKQLLLSYNQRKLKFWIWVLSLLVVILSLLVFTISTAILFETPEQVVTRQLNLIYQNNLRSAYQLCSTEFKKVASLEDFKQFVSDHPELKAPQKIDFDSTEVRDSLAVIKGSIKLNNGDTKLIEYRLVREGASWRIYYLTINSENDSEISS